MILKLDDPAVTLAENTGYASGWRAAAEEGQGFCEDDGSEWKDDKNRALERRRA